MRLIYVPEELTLFNLLELREVPASLGNILVEQGRDAANSGHFEEALAAVDGVIAAAKAQRQQVAFAIALLFKAEILHRLQRWEEALEHVRLASKGLHGQVSQIAAYNRTIALSFEGLVHLILRADDKVRLAFAGAQDGLAGSERYWGFEKDYARTADCRNLARWMSDLLDLLPDMPSGELTMVVPVYELVNQTPVRTSVMTVAPYQVALSGDVLRDYLPSHLIPLEIDALPFLQLRPDAHYLALKIPSDSDFASYSRAGDVLLLEVASPVPLTREVVLSSDAPFVRRTDGRVQFRPRRQDTGSFVGIPRVLIKAKEDGDE